MSETMYEEQVGSRPEANGAAKPATDLPMVVNQSAVMIQMRAELDIQVSTAKAYPRDPKRCIEQALQMATFNNEIANGCVYAKPIGPREVLRGPSIRLAEIMISTWGNVRVTPRITEMDQRFVTVETEVWDLESNTKTAWPCRRRLTDKYGKPYKESVVENTIAAATAISMRNATWKVIPKIYADHVYEACCKIIAGDAKSLSQKVKSCLGELSKMGVQEKVVLTYLDVASADLIDADMLITLRGLGNSIRAGEITIEEAFADPNAAPPAAEPSGKGTDAVKDRLKNRQAPAADQETGEVKEESPPASSAAPTVTDPRDLGPLKDKTEERRELVNTQGFQATASDERAMALEIGDLLGREIKPDDYSKLTAADFRAARCERITRNEADAQGEAATGSLDLGEAPEL